MKKGMLCAVALILLAASAMFLGGLELHKFQPTFYLLAAFLVAIAVVMVYKRPASQEPDLGTMPTYRLGVESWMPSSASVSETDNAKTPADSVSVQPKPPMPGNAYFPDLKLPSAKGWF